MISSRTCFQMKNMIIHNFQSVKNKFECLDDFGEFFYFCHLKLFLPPNMHV